MRLSTRGEYGLRTMVELANAYGAGPVPLGQIARSQGISLAYLEQLIAVLRRKGLVDSTRGARGGYQLAVAPEAISVGEVVRALEGPIGLIECVIEGKISRCARQTECTARSAWAKLRDSMTEVLDSITLADLRRR